MGWVVALLSSIVCRRVLDVCELLVLYMDDIVPDIGCCVQTVDAVLISVMNLPREQLPLFSIRFIK